MASMMTEGQYLSLSDVEKYSDELEGRLGWLLTMRTVSSFFNPLEICLEVWNNYFLDIMSS